MKARNSVYLMASRLIGLSIAFFTVPVVIRWVGGTAAYGVVLFSQSISTFVFFLDIGFMYGVRKYSIEALMEGKTDYANRIQRCQCLLSLWTGSAIFVVYLIVGALMRFEGIDHRSSFLIFALTGVYFFCQNYFQVFTTVAIVYDKFRALTVANVARDLIQITSLLILVSIFRTPVSMALGYAVGNLLGLIGFFVSMRRAGCPLYVRPLYDWDLIKHICGIGIRNVPNGIIGNLGNRGDKVLLGSAERNEAVFSNYALACRPIEYGYDMLRSAVDTLVPSVTRAMKASHELASTEMFKSGLIFWTLGCCCFIPASALGDQFLFAWLHYRIAYGGVIMVLMGFYYTAELHHLTLGTIFNANGTPHKLIVFAAYNAGVTLALTIPMYRWLGLEGIAIMNATINALQLPFRVWVVARELNAPFPYGAYMVRALSVLAICLGVYVVFWNIGHRWSFVTDSRFGFLPVACLALVLANMICFGTGITPRPHFLERRLKRGPRV